MISQKNLFWSVESKRNIYAEDHTALILSFYSRLLEVFADHQVYLVINSIILIVILSPKKVKCLFNKPFP